MSNILSKGLSSLKYVYLIVFFALLSGFFHPLITGQSFDVVISWYFYFICRSCWLYFIIQNYYIWKQKRNIFPIWI